MNLHTQTKPICWLAPAPQPARRAIVGLLEAIGGAGIHPALQLLAERARFLTGAAGVAVALEQDQQIVYTAATGSLVAEIGAIADIARYPPRVWVTRARSGMPLPAPRRRGIQSRRRRVP